MWTGFIPPIQMCIRDRETGLSSNFVGNIERGQGVASVRTLIKLMEALGCNADEIFAGIIGEKYECCLLYTSRCV